MKKFFRHVGALLSRNFIYRKRAWVSSLLQLLLPCLTIFILVAVKEGVSDLDGFAPTTIDPYYPEEAITPLSFMDYLTAIEADRTCVTRPIGFDPDLSGIRYFIDGIDIKDWPVPFIKCNARKCESEDEDAVPHCEYHVLALIPKGSQGDSRVADFIEYVENTYPQITDIIRTRSNGDLDYDLIKTFDTTDELDKYIKADTYGGIGYPKVALAVVIGGEDQYEYDYTIRTNSTNFNSPELAARPIMPTQPSTERKFDAFAKTAQDACDLENGTPDLGRKSNYCIAQYMYNGAIPMQRLVNDWIIDETGAASAGYRVAENGVSFMDFPEREYVEDGFYAQISPFAPLLLVLGLLYPVSAMIRFVVEEKELRQKELMKMMSISEASISFSWFLSFFLFFFWAGILVTIASKQLYPSSSFFPLLVFWELAFTACILFAMTVSAFFSKATRGTLVGVLFFFIGYFLTQTSAFDTGSASSISAVSIHPVAAISYGIQVIGYLEEAQVGVTFDTFNYSDLASGYSFQDSLSSLFSDVILWSIFCWYYTRVIPGDYGQVEVWYFPFTKSYWCKGGSSQSEMQAPPSGADESLVPIEEVSDALKKQENEGKGVHIRGLTKQFGEKTAVDGLGLSMYSGQIFALLGHNGAGKTTTINMLTGMVKPTSGFASVNGNSIETEMSTVRENVGICLQHDCLFPMLTVSEHVRFFMKIKGAYGEMTKEEAEESLKTTIEDVALLDKRNTFSKDLSGGMKRKLSLAIAFCGNSKVVFLDEPTSGMDPFSRRYVWNVIRQNRTDRCIILTTHFMDEADLLGDRIGIMSEGQLRCCGSSLFLKKRYGVGYQISIEKKPDRVSEQGIDIYDSIDNDLKKNVTKSVLDATILSNVGADMIFQLPLDSSDKFVDLFQDLDQIIDKGRIYTYGVSITTLDEVFLMVARGEVGTKQNFKSSRLLDASGVAETVSAKSYRSTDFSNEGAVFMKHSMSLLQKRAAYFKRDKKAWVCSVILPSLFAFLGFILVTVAAPNRNMPALELKLSDFNNVDSVPSEKKNPVPFGTADFLCQPGDCIASKNEVHVETDLFCGNLAKLSTDSICSDVLVKDNVPSKFGDDETFIIDQQSSTPLSVSQALPNNPETYDLAASQYGAIFFTHDASATTSGNLYSDEIQSVCAASSSAANSSVDCSLFNGIGYLVSVNFTSYHSSLMFQSAADEAIINTALASDEYKIKTTIHPLPLTALESSFGEANDVFAAWFLLVLSFPFISGTFATFVVSERMSKAKHLQTVAGVKPSAYWLSTYFWDILNYQFPLWIIVILMFAFGIKSYTTTEGGALGGTILTMILFGPASAGFTYIISFFFTNPSNCNMFVIVFNFFIGLTGPMVSFILRLIHAGQVISDSESNLKIISGIIEWTLRFNPSFCFGHALLMIANLEIFSTINGDTDMTVWSPDIALFDVIILLLQSVGYISLAIFIDKLSNNPKAVQRWKSIWSCKCFCSRKPNQEEYVETETEEPDEDVKAETDRVLSGGANNDLIVLNKLVKQYPNGKRAVNELSLGIPTGQCFGLLGINGAGKTTTMGILTAEFPPTSGDASLAGFSVTENPEETRRRIGYCPQFDAHFANLTGTEHVRLYAAIKGLPSDVIDEAVRSKLAEVGLNEFDSDRLSSNYSGGMKRKLSVACATIGDPKIVFLDEPSTGMDPVSRRDLWNVISNMVVGDASQDVSEKTSVILTTHSMEECEALCPRIAIMAGGKFSCLGSSQHLKTRFGQGYQIEMKVKQASESDNDVSEILVKLLDSKGIAANAEDLETGIDTDSVFFDLDETQAVLNDVAGDNYLSDKINQDDPAGYVIFKNASNTGATAHELAAFCATELRIRKLLAFFDTEYPGSVLREKEETKIRFEVPSAGLKISSLFKNIEENKDDLHLVDYGISQTTLEQVFNMHAAKAELKKEGQDDG